MTVPIIQAVIYSAKPCVNVATEWHMMKCDVTDGAAQHNPRQPVVI